jgi:hypothetical protein
MRAFAVMFSDLGSGPWTPRYAEILQNGEGYDCDELGAAFQKSVEAQLRRLDNPRANSVTMLDVVSKITALCRRRGFHPKMIQNFPGERIRLHVEKLERLAAELEEDAGRCRELAGKIRNDFKNACT